MRRKPWTPEQLAELARRYPHEPTAAIAADLGMTVTACYQLAQKLGIKKTQDYLSGPHASRLQPGDKTGMGTRFQPGHVPANKGLRRPGWAPGRMAETQFKPGRPASEARNYVPIGSLRLSKDGYLERKITDDPNLYPTRRWVAVHRLVWIEAHGPVPPKHVIVFKPGQRTAELDEITLDRVECISMVENMRRNSYHNRYPKEIGLAIQARGALMRKIHRAERATTTLKETST